MHTRIPNKPVQYGDGSEVFTKAHNGYVSLPFNPFSEILAEMAATFEAKNHDYTSANADMLANFREAEKYGVPMVKGVLVRMSDKMCRLQTLVTKEAKVKDESIIDTLTDLAVYAIIARLAIQDQARNENAENY